MSCVSRLVLFCFKQKTAYEMRISDWSSDVCSSDLFKGNASAHPTREHSAQFHLQSGGRCRDDGNHACRCSSVSRSHRTRDRKSVVYGKSVSVRVDLGGRRIIKKKNRRVQAQHNKRKSIDIKKDE